MTNQIAMRPTYWASVSGGKDSLYMLNLILHNLDKYPLDGVVHFELEIDFPFIKNVIDYMESECKRFGIPFYRIKPRTSWQTLYEKYGFPSRKTRWCNSKYKLDSARQLEEMMKAKGFYVVRYIGYCADEQKRFAKRDSRIVNEIYPLVDFGINEDEILHWAQGQPIFNEYYLFNRRCGCMFCPMAERRALAYMKLFYPKEYDQYMAMAKAHEAQMQARTGKPFSVFDGNPKYNAEYMDRIVNEKWIPTLIGELNK